MGYATRCAGHQDIAREVSALSVRSSLSLAEARPLGDDRRMRAARLFSPRPAASAPLEIADIADPEPDYDEVLVDVSVCAVCRTDLQICEGDLAAQRLPITPGHQVVGTVAAVGSGVANVAIGDRVGVAWIASTCGRCRFCTSGRENLCDQARFTGWSRDGGFAERVTARADFVHRLPHDFDAVSAAPLLCGGAIGLRALRVSGIEPGGRLGLYGFGASATCVIHIARYWGCEVYVCTRSERERQRAEALDACWTGAYSDRPPAPLDAAITFAPTGAVVIDALAALDKGGVVAINAIHLDRVPEFDYELLWGERQIRSVANVTRADVAELIELAATIPIRTVFERFPLDDANVALRRLAAGEVSGAAVLDVTSVPSLSAPA
jgi:propanol-preferring alcohol dehydrogenase